LEEGAPQLALHSLFVALTIAMPLVGLPPMLWSWRQLSRFLDQHPRLCAEADLKAFRAVARQQMYLALVQIGVLASPWVVFGTGLALGALERFEAVYSIGAFAIVLLGGLGLRGVEKRVQSVPATGPELTLARDAVVRTWRVKPLPDWDD
jgi:hypothetical protein